VRQAGEETLLERVASEALVEVLDLGDDHVADGRVVDGRLRVDDVLGLALAVHVQLNTIATTISGFVHSCTWLGPRCVCLFVGMGSFGNGIIQKLCVNLCAGRLLSLVSKSFLYSTDSKTAKH